MEFFTADFLHFVSTLSKFIFQVADRVLAINSNNYRDFLETSEFPKIMIHN